MSSAFRKSSGKLISSVHPALRSTKFVSKSSIFQPRSISITSQSSISASQSRSFHISRQFNMPEALKQEEVDSHTDPSLAKQYDDETPKDQQFKELYEMIDGNKISMLSTYRKGVGPIGRSMALARRDGPDLLFLSNKHSRKFDDLDANKEVQVTFQNTKTQDWISISGTVTTTSNDDPRIKDLYSPAISAWFGDLKDGVHDGTWKDPRMTLIEVQSKYILYWKKTVGTLGFMKEVGVAAMTGSVAQTGVTRELQDSDIQKERT